MALTTFISNTPAGALNGSGITNPAGGFKIAQAVTYTQNGYSCDVNKVHFPLQIGVPVSPIYTWDIIPASVSQTCISPATVVGTGTNVIQLPLQTTVQGTEPNIQSIPFTFVTNQFDQPQGVLLDCERCMTFYFSSPTQRAVYAFFSAYDYRGVYSQGGNSSNLTTGYLIPIGATSYTIPCPVSYIPEPVQLSESPYTTNTTATVSIGTSSYIGFPYMIANPSYIISAYWNNTNLVGTGTFIPAFNWRVPSSALNVNYSPRGFWSLPSAADGSKMLVITAYYPGADSELNAEIQNLNQSSLKVAQIQKKASSAYPTPVFVENNILPYDLTGVQINWNIPVQTIANIEAGNVPGDAVFYQNYIAACNA
jgi:hypothetical protein